MSVSQDTYATSDTMGTILITRLQADMTELFGLAAKFENYGIVDTGGAADAYTLAMTNTITSYTDGLPVLMRVTDANTGASTINIDSIGVKSIVQPDGTALAAGDLPAAGLAMLSYDLANTQFILMSSVSSYTTAAAASAAAAAVSAAAAAADEILTDADATATAADVVSTNADVVSTNADVVLTNADVVTTTADAAATALDEIATAADLVLTNADVVLTNADVVSTNADVVTTTQDAIDTAADAATTAQDAIDTAADVVLTNADVVTTNADVVLADAAVASISPVNSSITSMTGLDNDGIPLAKVANAASDGANSDITSLTGLTSAGALPSLTPVTDSAANFAANFTGANLYGGTFICNVTGTCQLPLMVAGMNFTIITLGAIEVVADTNAADGYLMDGTTNAEGKNLTNLSTAGDIAVFQYYTADDWLITTNGWTPEA